MVCARWFWWETGGISTPDTFSTWTALLTSLFSEVNVVPSVVAPAAAYLTPNPVRWDLGIQPVPVVIESVCRQNGLVVIRGLDGTVSVVDFLTAYNADNTRWNTIQPLVLAGGRIAFADVGRAAPASVDVVYFDGDVQNTVLADVPISPGFQGYGGVTGVEGKIGRVTADPASPTEAEKTAYTAAAVADYYNWFLFVTDCTLRAFYAGGPTGLEDVIEWVHHANGLVTRIIRPPWSDRNIYGEAAPDVMALGSAPEYKDECVNGYLVRKKAVISVTKDGLTQTEYELESSYGIPCVGESGSGPPPPDPPQGLVVTTDACVRLGFITTLTADATLTFEMDIVHLDGSAVTAKLPDPTGGSGPGADQLIIKNINAASATVDGNGALIDGAATVTLAQWDVVVLYTDQTDWYTK